MCISLPGIPNLMIHLRLPGTSTDGGADLIEIGLPFSDPIADGPTIQESSARGIGEWNDTRFISLSSLKTFGKLYRCRVLLMGYINPILQFGFEAFCKKCQEVGVDGLILPDLPMYEYEETYKEVLDQYGLYNVFLITPQTLGDRISKIDELSKGFIYMVSSSSTTGAKSGISEEQIAYFERIKALNLKNRKLIGFGISDYASFSKACAYADGAIVGSAFIKLLAEDKSAASISNYIHQLKNPQS